MPAVVLAGALLARLLLGVPASDSGHPSPVPSTRGGLEAPFRGTADSIVVEKASRRMTLYRDGTPVRRFRVALGTQPSGAKRVRGDGRTPEGVSRIDYRNPDSRYHLALHISYPSAGDRARAARLGRSPGGDVMIHGLPQKYAAVGAAHRKFDWTNGCVAVSDEEIEEIWRTVPVGTPVHIKP
jgi:murein L,D-transpeptidase YafK